MALTATPAAPAVQKPGAPPNPALFRIRDLIYQEAGIFHPDSKLRLLEDRCSRRMKDFGLISIRDYLDCLTGARGKSEMVSLLNEITIGETCFFRNQPQLDAFRKIVVPKVLQAKSSEVEPFTYLERRLFDRRGAIHTQHHPAGACRRSTQEQEIPGTRHRY